MHIFGLLNVLYLSLKFCFPDGKLVFMSTVGSFQLWDHGVIFQMLYTVMFFCQKEETWSNKKWNAFSRSKANSFILFVQIPTDRYGRIEYRVHPFWQEKFCPSHEKDKTPRCCSCERMEVCKLSVTEEVTFLMLQLLKSRKTSFSVNNYMHYIEKRSLVKRHNHLSKGKKKHFLFCLWQLWIGKLNP